MTTYILSLIVEGRDSASGPLGRITSALGNMGQIAGGIIGAQLFVNLGNQILEFGRKSLEATSNAQALQIGLEGLVARELRTQDETLGMTQALAQAAPAAKGLLEQIRMLAIQSPYELGQVQETFRLAMAFGFASDEAVLFTQAILNMSAGIGASNEMMGRMSYNLAQIRLQGKVTAVDVRQLALAGFDLVGALRAIGEQHGVAIESIEDFNAAIADGRLKWEDFAKDFAKYADEEFGGAAERMSKSLQGLKSNFSDVFTLSMPAILGPALDVITEFLNTVMQRFIDFTNSGTLEEWGQAIADSFWWVDVANGFMETFFRQLDAGESRFDAFRIALSTTFGRDTAARVLTALGNIKLALMDFSEWLAGLGNLELPGFDGTTVIEGLRRTFQNIVQFFQEQGPNLKATADRIFTGLLDGLKEVAEKVVPFVVEQMQKISDWLVDNGPLISDFAALFGEKFLAMIDVVVGFWDVISPLLSGIVDLLLGVITLIMQIATGDWQGAWDTLKLIVVNAWNAITATFMAFVNWVAGWFGGSWEEIKTIWSNNWLMFQEIATKVWNFITSWINIKTIEIKSNLAGKLQEITMIWYSKWNYVLMTAIGIWQTIVSWVSSKMSDMRSGIISVMDNISSSMSTKWSNIKSSILAHIETIKSGAIAKFNEMKTSLETKMREIAKMLFDRAQGWLQQIIRGTQGMAEGVIAQLNAIIAEIQAGLADIIIDVIFRVGQMPNIPGVPPPVGGGGGCFVAGTPVLMADRSTRSIELVQVGDRIISRHNGANVVTAVTETFAHAAEETSGYLVINHTIGVTGNHMMLLTGGEWARADSLEVGSILTGVWFPVVVTSIEWVDASVSVYNLHVDHECHNYYVHGVCVHNTKNEESFFNPLLGGGGNNRGALALTPTPRPSLGGAGGENINVQINVERIASEIDLDLVAAEVARRIKRRSGG